MFRPGDRLLINGEEAQVITFEEAKVLRPGQAIRTVENNIWYRWLYPEQTNALSWQTSPTNPHIKKLPKQIYRKLPHWF